MLTKYAFGSHNLSGKKIIMTNFPATLSKIILFELAIQLLMDPDILFIVTSDANEGAIKHFLLQ